MNWFWRLRNTGITGIWSGGWHWRSNQKPRHPGTGNQGNKGETMTRNETTLVVTMLLFSACRNLGRAQTLPPTILEIDVENYVQYMEDTSDISRFATDPNATTAVPPRNFSFFLQIADIVAVNGQPAKGTLTRNSRLLNLTTSPDPGQAMAD